MATAVKRLGFQARQCVCRIPARQRPQTLPAWQRPFSSTPARCEQLDDFAKTLNSEDRAFYQSLPPEERALMRTVGQSLGEHMARQDVQQAFSDEIDDIADEVERQFPPNLEEREERKSQGFWALGEPEMGEDEEFQGDDISSIAHGELEQHREFREYARLAAWELPLLSKLSVPFEPPSENQPLRFRYTSYMGEQHPAARKVVVEFSPFDMPELSYQQRGKLIKLCGARYNPSSRVVKMSCESFETQAQNKRYLGDLVNKLLTEARDPTDTFEDVPFDFRHHKRKPNFAFPQAWLMTPERQKQLEEKRQQRLLLDQQRTQQGTLITGAERIQQAIENEALAAAAEPVVVEAQQQRGKGREQQRQSRGRR
ncbi:hypothetical protein W97_07784 [Coniosporium apollinis CBS 100218]|uniref:Small ribosomal subunit protein mS35 mitochondrial conserved domain-containing protein n=1 Tax=Coniosporium apollinis (strain CBS 100218) TaxID=1168221 RepID=R7Z3M7_CONA1|nr:uncharacterized protein W97_07784 [Coniosporium apollinis CBS 100218]EON68526.1 hypothetical protein W97_07784 [Coniosporium apollinis CBS 100218]